MTDHATPHDPAAPAPLPNVATLLIAQVAYQSKLLLGNGRAVMIGIGLPVILLISSSVHGRIPASAVAGRAVFGLTLTAWNTYGIRLVAAREAGILKRWRATPLPRWCYFAARILASVLVAVLAAVATVLVAVLLYHTRLTVAAALGMLLVFVLAAAAWAAAATALTAVVPTVEMASGVFVLVYFPVIIISGVLGAISEPGWLRTIADYLPATPSIDGTQRALHHVHGTSLLSAHDLIVLGAWVVIGLAVALATFRWEPHRPAQRRARRAAA